MRGFDLFRGDALNAYRDWPAPATIVSDGAYGVRGFHGDTIGPEALPRWYRPHIAAWAAAAGPATTLWFWNTELGWASVHPVLRVRLGVRPAHRLGQGPGPHRG